MRFSGAAVCLVRMYPVYFHEFSASFCFDDIWSRCGSYLLKPNEELDLGACNDLCGTETVP